MFNRPSPYEARTGGGGKSLRKIGGGGGGSGATIGRGAQSRADQGAKIFVKEGKETHTFIVDLSMPCAAFLDLVGERKGLDKGYLRILVKGKELPLQENLSLGNAGLRSGSKLTMLFSSEYHQDKELLTTLQSLGAEVTDIESRASADIASTKDRRVTEELLTILLEKIDGVDTLGRPSLRACRKKLVQRCQHASAENTAHLKALREQEQSGGGSSKASAKTQRVIPGRKVDSSSAPPAAGMPTNGGHRRGGNL